MRNLTLGTILAATILAPAVAQPAPPPGGGRPGMMLPATRDEAAAQAQARFARIDRNGDGVLTTDELPTPRAGNERGGSAGGMLARFDRDGDGKLSAAEFGAGALALFDSQDADHDGRISDAERAAWRERAMAGRPQG
jgi:hypothetical protein